MSVDSKLQFTHASSSSHSWLSKQPQQVQSSKRMVASLSCAELGTAQPRPSRSSTFQKCFKVVFQISEISFKLNFFWIHFWPQNFFTKFFFTLNLIWMQFFEFFGNKVFVCLVFKRQKMLWDPKFSGQ